MQSVRRHQPRTDEGDVTEQGETVPFPLSVYVYVRLSRFVGQYGDKIDDAKCHGVQRN
jgi:hypothetical protein